MQPKLYVAPGLVDHGSVIYRTLGDLTTDTQEQAFVSLRSEDNLHQPVSRPVADKLINGLRMSFDPATGRYVDETADEAF